MPDFKGLDPIVVNQDIPNSEPVYNPAPIAENIDSASPKASAMDIFNYYRQTPNEKPSDMVITGKELADNKRYKFYNPTVTNQEDYHRWGQTGWERAGAAADNFVEKTGAYLVQTVGFIGGAMAGIVGGSINYADQWTGGDGKVVSSGNAISLLTDNFLTNLGEVWKENVQERSPIYKSSAYTDGNIWQKLGSSDWWLDDAIDRSSCFLL